METPLESPDALLGDCRTGLRDQGNINRYGERIYHTPWGSHWYELTKVTESKGERWFCNEAEALAAGWRAPLR